jgi:acetyl-CoA C-acetyltransferase
MRDVSIIGASTTPFGELDAGVTELGSQAVAHAMDDGGVGQGEVDAVYIGNFVAGILEGQGTVGPIITDEVGLTGVPAMSVEGACASSGIAFRQAYNAVATGIHDTVIAGGVESMTDADTPEFTRALGSAAHQRTEGTSGLTFPGFYGIYLDRYLHEYDATRQQIAQVAVKNRANGASNPRARFQEEVNVETVLNSAPVADPLRLYDCCPAADGAAAVVLTASEHAKSFTDRPVNVLASAHSSGPNATHRYEDLTTLDATVTAANQAYIDAGVEPDDIDVIELHDCFTPAEVGDAEDLGLFQKGEAAQATSEGKTAVDGSYPINPSGGLLAKGHPVGATGVGQIYEVRRQLLENHENQVENPRLGLTHNAGGSGVVCTVTILERDADV